MKDLGMLKYFLGIEVARTQEGIFLCERKYTLDIISKSGLFGAKPTTFPMEQNHHLGDSISLPLKDVERHLKLVGRLIYLTFTHPDLSFAVHILSQFMHAPRQDHWSASFRVVRYLKGCPGQGIFLSSSCNLYLSGWCDTDWASCPATRRSVFGWMVFLDGSPVSWKTKKHVTVAHSFTEVEYRPMDVVTYELKWLKGLLNSLGISHPTEVTLFCDG
ncbi:transmembrane signal receptor [Lithospermum erythrorhizon]|uniref:Transmembrane signal receptor n=1 Tax=Lithospermum erythrorhizon TaxID=34254 RepID=A0AAV3QX60_LITER